MQAAFGPGAPGAPPLAAPAGDAAGLPAAVTDDPGMAATMPAQRSTDGRYALVQAVPAQDPSKPAVGHTIDRLRDALPAASFGHGRP